MVRDRQDFEALRQQSSYFSYFEDKLKEQKHIFSQRSNVPEEQLEYFLPHSAFTISR